MKLNFDRIPDELKTGTLRLQTLLKFEVCSSGIPMEIQTADKICVSLKDGKGRITYTQKGNFFRALGLFCEHARGGEDFCVEETPPFETVGTMLNVTSGPFTVDALKKMMDYFAVMGYNMIMMYTEDTYDVKTRPYFGYMAGKYTEEEIREADDYAFDYGIEMIPCIQTLGHMGNYLKWPAAESVKDTAAVLLADSEETYTFLDEIISAASRPYRSKRIHLGMDEAWDLGRGAYISKHGYKAPFDIFVRHLNRVVDITNKYGLVPMIWSDMIFRINHPNNEYYKKEIVIPDEIKAQIPKEVEMVYWHYGEEPGCDDYMIEKHMDLGNHIMFAGGIWSWTGHVPENNYAFEATKIALDACKKYGIKEMMTTVWSNSTDIYLCLLGLSFTAEMAYTGATDTDTLARRFYACTEGDYKAFFSMSEYHNIFDDGRTYDNYHNRFMGMRLFWQDILEGIHDKLVYDQPMSEHYKKYGEIMAQYDGVWKEHYTYVQKIFECLYVKTYIAERLKPAYDSGNKALLQEIAEEWLPTLKDKIHQVYKCHKKLWHQVSKPFYFGTFEYRYAGLEFRTESAIETLKAYLSGEISEILELKEPRLDYPKTGFPKMHQVGMY